VLILSEDIPDLQSVCQLLLPGVLHCFSLTALLLVAVMLLLFVDVVVNDVVNAE
jgi:hypothetical protein